MTALRADNQGLLTVARKKCGALTGKPAQSAFNGDRREQWSSEVTGDTPAGVDWGHWKKNVARERGPFGTAKAKRSKERHTSPWLAYWINN